jgi:glycosyltransferase involved in cell wall biosynthesis
MMKSKPEISFVLPMYNTEIDYLDQCIDSLKKQTLNNIEGDSQR